MDWDQGVEEKLKLLVSKLPLFHRHIAEQVVIKKAEELAAGRSSQKVQREDLVGAFLSEVPEVFRKYLNELLKEVDLT
jgi:hypothetical protein